MQATLCDNCRKPAETALQQEKWRKLTTLKVHTHGDTDGANPFGNMPPQLAAILGGGGQGDHKCEGHVEVDKIYDLCSDECVTSFIANGWRSLVPSMAD